MGGTADGDGCWCVTLCIARFIRYADGVADGRSSASTVVAGGTSSAPVGGGRRSPPPVRLPAPKVRSATLSMEIIDEIVRSPKVSVFVQWGEGDSNFYCGSLFSWYSTVQRQESRPRMILQVTTGVISHSMWWFTSAAPSGKLIALDEQLGRAREQLMVIHRRRLHEGPPMQRGEAVAVFPLPGFDGAIQTRLSREILGKWTG